MSELGRGVIVAAPCGGRTVLTTVRAESPLRFIQTTFPGTTCAAVCLVTFGGGLVDGDRIDVDIEVARGATLVVFTQASTKVFRGASAQALRATVAGTLILLPDPAAAFGAARYTQRVDVALRGDGACVALDGFTSGRAAFGERWAMTLLDLRTRVTHDGRPVVTDALRFASRRDGDLARRAGPFEAFATLVAVGRASAPIAAAIESDAVAPPTRDLAIAASALPRAQHLGLPGAMLRVAAGSPARALAAARSRLRDLAKLDAVDPFASRH